MKLLPPFTLIFFDTNYIISIDCREQLQWIITNGKAVRKDPRAAIAFSRGTIN
jgi:hypothetical protein